MSECQYCSDINWKHRRIIFDRFTPIYVAPLFPGPIQFNSTKSKTLVFFLQFFLLMHTLKYRWWWWHRVIGTCQGLDCDYPNYRPAVGWQITLGITKCKVKSAKCKVQSKKCKVQSAKLTDHTWNYKVQIANCKAKSVKCKADRSHLELQSEKCKVQDGKLTDHSTMQNAQWKRIAQW